MEDIRSDEALVLAFYAGEKTVFDVIFYRYIKYLRFFLLKESWLKDDSSLDDIIQDIFLVVLKALNEKDKFNPRGAGSFRAWFYSVARNVCRTYNREESNQPLHVAQQLLETAPDKPTEPEIIREEEGNENKEKIKEILSKLEPEERDLIFLLGEGKKYKEIHEMDEFNKHSVDYLMLKVYNIRKKILGGL